MTNPCSCDMLCLHSTTNVQAMLNNIYDNLYLLEILGEFKRKCRGLVSLSKGSGFESRKGS